MYLMLHHLNNIKSYKVNEISLYISLEMERIIDKGDQIKVFFCFVLFFFFIFFIQFLYLMD